MFLSTGYILQGTLSSTIYPSTLVEAALYSVTVTTAVPCHMAFLTTCLCFCRYRTQLCNDGTKCKRHICFFAHSLEELRVPTCKPFVPPDALAAATTAAATDIARKVTCSDSSASSWGQSAHMESEACYLRQLREGSLNAIMKQACIVRRSCFSACPGQCLPDRRCCHCHNMSYTCQTLDAVFYDNMSYLTASRCCLCGSQLHFPNSTPHLLRQCVVTPGLTSCSPLPFLLLSHSGCACRLEAIPLTLPRCASWQRQ